MRISLIALSAVSTLIGSESFQINAVHSQAALPGEFEAARDQTQMSATSAVPALAAPESFTNQQFISNRGAGKYLAKQVPESFANQNISNRGAGKHLAKYSEASVLANALAVQPHLSDNLSDGGSAQLGNVPSSQVVAQSSLVEQTGRAPITLVDNLPIDQFVAASLQSEIPAAVMAPRPAAALRSSNSTVSRDYPVAPAVTALGRQGVRPGFADGTFRPDLKITDHEFKLVMQSFDQNAAALADLRRPSTILSRIDTALLAYQKMPMIAATANVAYAESANQLVGAATDRQEMFGAELVAASPPESAKQVARQTSPATASREPDAYVLGAGDRIRVEIFNVPEYTKEYQVLVDGTVNIYRIGEVAVAGMTLKQAEAVLTSRYDRLVKRTLVDVSLMAARPLNLAIAGEVGRPGTYTFTPEGNKVATITRLIQLAGGMTQAADPRQVQVRRSQLGSAEQIIGLDLWDLFQTGNLQQDLVLRDGDSIFIGTRTDTNLAEAAQFAAANFATDPSQPLNIALVGEVLRPGPYLMKGGTTSTTTSAGTTTVAGGLPTVTQAIQNAGGITQLADIRNVEVRRTTRSGQPQIIALNLWDLVNSGNISQDIGLQQGDTIVIPKAKALSPQEVSQLATASFSPKTMRVNVVGETVKPGTIEVPPNTPLNQALLAAGGFTRDAKKKSVELVRLNPDGTVSQRTIVVDFARGIDEQGNPLLLNNDIVIVSRSGAAKFSDGIGTVLGPLLRFLPFRGLF